MIVPILVCVVLLLSFANGANDNLKGVATLLGSGTTNYKRALWWATICTLLGSLTAVGMATALLKSFSGKGLVADSLVQLPEFAASVASGAALTVLLATRFGLPVSTTHGLLGALVGAGLAAGSSIHSEKLLTAFVLPLLLSPLLALACTMVGYPILSRLRAFLGVVPDSCVCLDSVAMQPALAYSHAGAIDTPYSLGIRIGKTSTCRTVYSGKLLGLEAQSVLDSLHFASAGLVSFARGLNDTPKIAAVMLVGSSMGGLFPMILVGACIAAGGILRGKQVSETMSQRITEMNHGQGFTANALAGSIVIVASWLGMPVSTTHVTCGSLFGIGIVSNRAHWRTIGGIGAAWLITLPLGMLLGSVSFLSLTMLR